MGVGVSAFPGEECQHHFSSSGGRCAENYRHFCKSFEKLFFSELVETPIFFMQ